MAVFSERGVFAKYFLKRAYEPLKLGGAGSLSFIGSAGATSPRDGVNFFNNPAQTSAFSKLCMRCSKLSLRMRRSSTRGMLRGLFGSIGLGARITARRSATLVPAPPMPSPRASPIPVGIIGIIAIAVIGIGIRISGIVAVAISIIRIIPAVVAAAWADIDANASKCLGYKDQ
jgi:hypothetical protein